MTGGKNTLRIALIGFGEVGRRFARDLKGNDAVVLSAFDILTNQPAKRGEYESAARELKVAAKSDAAGSAAGADIVISAVTAAAALSVAQEASRYLKPGQIFFDINSAAPQTKQQAEKLFPAAVFFVEGAVMAPVVNPGIRVPILAGGLRAEEIATRLNAIGFNVTPVSQEIGHASATKLCRSIIIKGLEALMFDCARASKSARAESAVYASLAETFPSIDWPALAENMQERIERHGIRRAEEMREAAQMLAAFGIDEKLALAVADAQERGAKRHD